MVFMPPLTADWRGELSVGECDRLPQNVQVRTKSSLHETQELLLRFIFDQREQGNTVDISTVVNTAKILDAAFRGKSDMILFDVCGRPWTRVSCVYICNWRPFEWMRMIRPLLLGDNRDPRFIHDVDQTPIIFR
jgi:hypothetical protein